jgi:hypothetical protein
VTATPAVAEGSVEAPAATRAVAVSAATVEVVLTLNVRDVPSAAYTAIGTSAAYSPSCTGSPAMAA